MKKAAISIFLILLLIIGSIALHLFVIGEPVDGNTLAIYVQETDHQVNIDVHALDSAMAFSDVRFQHKGTVLYITLRKVLVSPLHDTGSKSIWIEKVDETEIWLGGKLIWSAE